MLKAELRAKMFQLDPDWAKVEDILTGDFFGALDYLPRNPFLSCFLERVVALNETARTPELSQVDWSNVKLLFWPRVQLDEEQVEPDVVVVSNRWTIVIEVKLDSGLGVRQPWREYQAGQSIARKHGLPSHAVYYLVRGKRRTWVRRAERDAGKRAGLTTDERQRLKELERENRELKRANEILRKASAFFAQAELDRRPR